jgi:hypothetical protein
VVDFGSGVVIPAGGSFELSDDALPYDVAGSYSYIDGRFELVAVTYQSRSGGYVVTGENVRKIPVDRILRDHLSSYLPRRKKTRRMVRPIAVASTYSLAYACHLSPTQAVADAFGITHGAAEQRVIQARELGYLAPTRKGKAKA